MSLLKALIICTFLFTLSNVTFGANVPKVTPLEAKYIEECNEQLKTCMGALVIKNIVKIFPPEIRAQIKAIQDVLQPTFDAGPYGKIRFRFSKNDARVEWKVRY